MTAELGLLNKTNVVLAADSAVTIGLYQKSFNTANKLFPLSNYEPIGIMIYNNADWMGIPLEIIIKAYTKQLGDISFTTLEAYRDDFLKFIKNNFNHFITNEQIQDIIEIRLHLVLDVITELFEAKLNDEIDELQNDNKTFNIKDVKQKVFFEVIDYISQIKDEILPEFENYKIEEFKLEYKSVIDKILPGFFIHNKIDKTQKIVNRIYKRLYHEFICIFSDDEDFTGIVIAGYGSDEIFPSISEIKIGEIISNKLRYEIKPIESIDNNNITAIISPFAQRDVVDTFIRGINVKSQNAIFDRMVNKIYEACDKISIKNSIDIKILLDEIMPVIDDVFEFTNELSFENHISPIVDAISYLRKEDLIEIAESLIHLTSIKRKTSKEIQSVGGPIDIAVITKHEGFIWIKRKDFVNREFNSAFYNREFKKI